MFWPPLHDFNPIRTWLSYLVVAVRTGGGGGGFHPFHKIQFRHPRAMKLGGLIAYIRFYKIC